MNKLKSNLSWIIWSSIAIFVLSLIWHNLYDWMGSSKLIAWLAPVNESVWEHLKLTLWPMILVWMIMGPFFSDGSFRINKAIVCIFVSMLLANMIILGVHYTFKSGFDIENMAVDIIALIVGILIGQMITSIFILPYNVPLWAIIVCWILLVAAVLGFAYLSYMPYNAPIFAVPVESP